ncbi:MAG TPA: hypothetical protein VGE62_02190 [Candidatus Paceibacterota bacterium]
MKNASQILKMLGLLTEHGRTFEHVPSNVLQWAISSPKSAAIATREAIQRMGLKVLPSYQKIRLTAHTERWRQVETGGTDPSQWIKRNADPDLVLSDWAKKVVLQDGVLAMRERAMSSLVTLSLRDLGFSSMPSLAGVLTEDFCMKWSAFRLIDGESISLCEPEDPFCLASLHDIDYDQMEFFHFAMKPMSDGEGPPCRFVLICNGRQREIGCYQEGSLDLDSLILFRLISA